MGNVLAGTMDPGCSSMVLVTKQHQFNPYGGAWFAGVPPLYNLRPAARAVQHPAGGWSVFAIWGGLCRFRVVWLPPATGTKGPPYNDGALDPWDVMGTWGLPLVLRSETPRISENFYSRGTHMSTFRRPILESLLTPEAHGPRLSKSRNRKDQHTQSMRE